ncbi:MAG: bifunctional folylpolyglutamate synthase/dihydrofolate synthase [Oscillospiraceae bacterium]|nr:bifunctional folylpolyglutamate synthase/dihydrofolate synthase [Oscillospiraceae bacterium]
MTYQQSLEKIHSLLHLGSRPGLDRMLKLLDKIGNPQNKCKFVHIAGTNGKGSVSQMISSVLTEAKLKTGLFISPYITDFRERIQINGQMIPKDSLADAVEYIFPVVEEMAKNGDVITEFEFVNAVAFYYYAKENCDIVVLETGMGGLLDCTNTIPSPLCSVITPIALDHTAVLGDTIEKITYQKCGIIKEKSFTVIGKQTDSAIERQIVKYCVEHKNIYHFAEDCKFKVIASSLEGTTVKYKGRKLNLHLAGLHQIANLKTALKTIEVLIDEYFYPITKDDIEYGIAKAKNPARFELLSKSPKVILDGAHNPNGMEAFSKSVEEYTSGKRVLVMGMLRDKDISHSIDFIKGKFQTVITLTVDNPRSLTGEELADICRDKFPNVITAESPKDAVEIALDLAKKEDCTIMICGSLYLAGEIRPIILERLSE